ncbi:hypothetical protein RND71_007998 [Anisodus tanguticus]|uniref:Uncharacterized protein n=1 Tax=Anisodus tanguticus TaxID=243964 RepID=A0AAE1SKX5_9SOLA|nr:hypothetical protein RND71_007998 [Anisodus tanguticus]
MSEQEGNASVVKKSIGNWEIFSLDLLGMRADFSKGLVTGLLGKHNIIDMVFLWKLTSSSSSTLLQLDFKSIKTLL